MLSHTSYALALLVAGSVLFGPATAKTQPRRIDTSSAAITIAKRICGGRNSEEQSWKAVAFDDRWEVSAMPKDGCAPRPSIVIPRDGREPPTCTELIILCDPPPTSVDH